MKSELKIDQELYRFFEERCHTTMLMELSNPFGVTKPWSIWYDIRHKFFADDLSRDQFLTPLNNIVRS